MYLGKGNRVKARAEQDRLIKEAVASALPQAVGFDTVIAVEAESVMDAPRIYILAYKNREIYVLDIGTYPKQKSLQIDS